MDSNEMRRDIVDRGIERAEQEMKEALQPISEHNAEIRAGSTDPDPEWVGEHHSGQTASDASDQAGATPFNLAQGEDLPERAGISRREDAARKREVDPEAVRESFKEAELDPKAETEPEPGEKAA